jgi:hypothetical protein
MEFRFPVTEFCDITIKQRGHKISGVFRWMQYHFYIGMLCGISAFKSRWVKSSEWHINCLTPGNFYRFYVAHWFPHNLMLLHWINICNSNLGIHSCTVSLATELLLANYGCVFYYSFRKLLSYGLLYKPLMFKIYKLIFSYILYDYEKWSLTLMEEHDFVIF